MATKPILFSTPMVQAIQAGRKTQTRRVVKSRHESGMFQVSKTLDGIVTGITSIDWDERPKNDVTNDIKPIAVAGDILWVRETWSQWNNLEHPLSSFAYKADGFVQRYGAWERDTPNGIADIERIETWKPSIFMPKEAARIFLKVTNVRAERLKDISEDDAIAEGILRIKKAYRGGTAYYDYSGKQTPASYNFDSPIASFKTLWQSINGRESWEANPWVWVYEFEQIDKPKDFGNG